MRLPGAIAVRVALAIGSVAAMAAMAACGPTDDALNDAQDNIVESLRSQNVYERGNLPDPVPTQIEGNFDIIGGAYRYIVNEGRANRNDSRQIMPGDSIAFMFDARVFTRGNFDSQNTFYTNIEARRSVLTGGNGQFDPTFWPTEPYKIKVGEDPRILKSLQRALIEGAFPCRAGDGNPDNDADGGVASDQVRVYLTPDIAFGDRTVYDVPAGSTLVFEVTEIEIIE